MKRVFSIVIWFLSLLTPYKLVYIVRKIHTMWHSQIIKRALSGTGHNFFIMSPCNLHGGRYITVGDNFDCMGRLRLEAYDCHNGVRFEPKIIIGDNVGINFDCHIACINKIQIGNGVLIASKVFITDHFHGEITYGGISLPPAHRKLFSRGPVIIQDNVWVGEGVVIMPGVTIGRNSIIGANAVVTRDVPDNVVVGGNPARIIKSIV